MVAAHELFQPLAAQLEDALALLGAGGEGVAHNAGAFFRISAALGKGGKGKLAVEGRGAAVVGIEAALIDEVDRYISCVFSGIYFAASEDIVRQGYLRCE